MNREMKVLVVEDDPISALVLSDAVVPLGFEPIVAEDGLEGWRRIEEDDYRLVITDWMMPEMSGIELCRKIRSRTGHPYVYTVLLTARGSREDRMEGLNAGADDYLTKPLDAGEFAAR